MLSVGQQPTTTLSISLLSPLPRSFLKRLYSGSHLMQTRFEGVQWGEFSISLRKGFCLLTIYIYFFIFEIASVWFILSS